MKTGPSSARVKSLNMLEQTNFFFERNWMDDQVGLHVQRKKEKKSHGPVGCTQIDLI